MEPTQPYIVLWDELYLRRSLSKDVKPFSSPKSMQGKRLARNCFLPKAVQLKRPPKSQFSPLTVANAIGPQG
jgi:hypothetical protein